MNHKEAYLDTIFSHIDVPLTDQMRGQFMSYYDLLVQRNREVNLTAITDYEEVVRKHFFDSVTISLLQQEIKEISFLKEQSVIDVGSGAGFPGIPLKIVFPKLNLLMMDSLNKRISFLDEVIRTLHLEDVTAIHARAEELAHSQIYRERFDVCVSRAVSNLSVLSEYTIPYIKKDGFFVAYKGAFIDDELEQAKHAIQLLGGEIFHVKQFSLPMTDEKRTFVVIKKVSSTDNKYPRRAGIPEKRPLC